MLDPGFFLKRLTPLKPFLAAAFIRGGERQRERQRDRARERERERERERALSEFPCTI